MGYVLHDIEHYLDENNVLKKRKAYVWRFIGFGRSCFAKTKEELLEKVTTQIKGYLEDRENRGYNSYPYYTRYYRTKKED